MDVIVLTKITELDSLEYLHLRYVFNFGDIIYNVRLLDLANESKDSIYTKSCVQYVRGAGLALITNDEVSARLPEKERVAQNLCFFFI